MTKNIVLLKREEKRIIHGANDDPIGGLGTNRFIVHCNGNASLVLQQTKDVLLLINRALQNGLPTLEEWQNILPNYFVFRCSPINNIEYTEREIVVNRKIRSVLTADEILVWRNSVTWSLENWIHWFQDEERYWYWWDAVTYQENHIFVAIEIHEWPCSCEELSWLFRGCGACFVEPEPDDVNPSS